MGKSIKMIKSTLINIKNRWRPASFGRAVATCKQYTGRTLHSDAVISFILLPLRYQHWANWISTPITATKFAEKPQHAGRFDSYDLYRNNIVYDNEINGLSIWARLLYALQRSRDTSENHINIFCILSLTESLCQKTSLDWRAMWSAANDAALI